MTNSLEFTMTKAKELKEHLDNMKKEANEKGKEIFKEASALLFQEIPELESFGWTQYTPYFNDGDACYFGTHREADEIYVNGENTYDREDRGEDVEADDKHYALCKKVSAVLSAFDGDVFESLFGDHAKIIVTKDNIEVSRYNHD